MTILDETLKLTAELISFKTTADKPEALAEAIDYIEDYLSGTPLKVRKFERNNKPSLLITLTEGNPEILLNGHLDVVPGKAEQFTAEVRNGKIFGRGALDMKSGLAVLLVLMEDLAKNGLKKSVGLSIVSDEEIGGKDGTGYLIEQGVKPKFFLSAEPTDLKIGNEARGIIWLKIEAFGKSAHASTPWLGDNANIKIIRALNLINEHFPNPKFEEWVTTRNISVIKGGEATNKVPDNAEAFIDIRYVPSDDSTKIINQIKELASDCEIEVQNLEPPAFADPDDLYLKLLKNSLESSNIRPEFLKKYAASDARYYTKVGIPAVVFGPSGSGQHSDNEFVDIDSLEKLFFVLKTFILT